MENENFKLFEIPKIQAPNFIMSPAELNQYIDFDVKRIYYITKPTGDTGSHCHKIEEELFILIQGSCTAVIDRGFGLEEYTMSGPQSAMYVGAYVWHHFKDLSEDAILLAISSTNYNPTRSDYVENYEEFQKIIHAANPAKKVLVLGSDGTLGQYIKEEFGADSQYEVIASTRQTIDFTDEKNARKVIERIKPEIIINCAAYNNVDAAETEGESYKLAQKLNGDAIAFLSQIANELNTQLVHYSSEYVFDGQNQEGYTENAQPAPLNKYGHTKLAGEQAAQLAHKHLVIRTSRLFGKKGASPESKKSFVDIMIDLSESKNHLDIVLDELSSPTYAKDLAHRTKALIEGGNESGIYHATNDGVCTWYEFAQEVFKIKGITIDTTPVDASKFPRPAKRPQFGALLQTKTQSMRNWKEALQEYLNEPQD